MYCGYGKPSNLEKFFANFIEEINDLIENKINIDEQKMEVKLMSFICDCPARSFIKCVKSHTAYYGCERCTAKGVNFKSRRIYPFINYMKKKTMTLFC